MQSKPTQKLKNPTADWPAAPQEPRSFAPNKYVRSDRELAEIRAKGNGSIKALIRKLPENGFDL